MKILLLMTQFYYASSHFANGPGGNGLTIGANRLFRIMGKEICFKKIGPKMMAEKYKLQNFYDNFDLHVGRLLTKRTL